MTDLVKNSTAGHAIDLLNHYSFDLEGYSAEQFVQQWASSYQPRWVRAAVIEALYQGRYKAVSVGQILAFWHRRGEPLCHFNHEFERIICSSSPQNLTTQTVPESLLAAARKAEKRELEEPGPTPNLAGTEAAVSATAQPVPSGFGPEPDGPGEPPVEPMGAIAESPPIQVTHDPTAEPMVAAMAAPDHSDTLTADSTAEPETSADLPLPIPEMEPANSDQTTAPVSDLSAAEVDDQDLPLGVFHPLLGDEPYEIYQANWSRPEAGKYPIHQFVPTPATPEFHEKLKSVAQQVKR